MMADITDYERDLLRHLDGQDVPGLAWGAVMGEALGFLKGSGYVRIVPNGDGAMRYEITDKGREISDDG